MVPRLLPFISTVAPGVKPTPVRVNLAGLPVGIGLGLTAVTLGPAGSIFTYSQPMVPSEATASMRVLSVGILAGDL